VKEMMREVLSLEPDMKETQVVIVAANYRFVRSETSGIWYGI